MDSVFGKISSQAGKGFVRCRVFLPLAQWAVDVTLLVDTGSVWTLLVDEDFSNALLSLGICLNRDPACVDTITALCPCITRIGRGHCLAGETQPIFQFDKSRIYLCDEYGQVACWRQSFGPVYGVFSTPYLGTWMNAKKSQNSLLGTDLVRELDRMDWRPPKAHIRCAFK